MNQIHYVHIFASDLMKSISPTQKVFDRKAILDAIVAGAHILMRIGKRRLHFRGRLPKYSWGFGGVGFVIRT